MTLVCKGHSNQGLEESKLKPNFDFEICFWPINILELKMTVIQKAFKVQSKKKAKFCYVNSIT